MNKNLRFLLIFITVISSILSAWHLFYGQLTFHTDIARDFLLIEDIVRRDPIALIGPRAGGISGVFHGPLWLYLNVPAFILGQGNPVIIGWFWLLLSLVMLGFTYFVAKKLFDEDVALLSITLLSARSIDFTRSLFNPFGAVLLFPLYFYFFYRYIQSLKVRNLIIALFIIGLIIQFQMAFGIPILVVSTLYLLKQLWKEKKLPHFFSYAILAVPLSTYILFEIKHGFLQTNAVLSYISGSENSGKMNFLNLVLERIRGMFMDGMQVFYYPWLNIIFAAVLCVIIYRLYKKKKVPFEHVYKLFFLFYFGFWAISFLFGGVIWNYYYWPFLPVMLMVLASTYKIFDKRVFTALFVGSLAINLFFSLQGVVSISNYSRHPSDWKFDHAMAQEVYIDAPAEFGYYIYSPDLFGYSNRYAMNYVQTQHQNKKAVPFEKRRVTYLLIAAPPTDRPALNGDWWKINQVKINKKPVNVFKYPNGFVVEKYELGKEDLAIPSDPNLINSLHFR